MEGLYEEEARWKDFGQRLHMFILEPEEFNKNFIHLEVEVPKSPQQKKFCEDFVASKKKTVKDKAIEAYNKNYKAPNDKKALELQESNTDYIKYLKSVKIYKDIINDSDWETLNEMKAELKNHKLANELLFSDPEELLNEKIIKKSELEIYFTFDGIECKSMLDRLIIDHENKEIKLVDLKTTSNMFNFSESFDKFDYGRQLAFYWTALMYYCKESIFSDDDEWFKKFNEYKKTSYIVAIQSRGINECKVFRIPEKTLDDYADEITDLMLRYKWHKENNKWDYTMEYYLGDGSDQLL